MCISHLLVICLLQGLVEAVGVSNYGPKQLQRIYDHLTKRGIPLASCQVRMHLPFLAFECGVSSFDILAERG